MNGKLVLALLLAIIIINIVAIISTRSNDNKNDVDFNIPKVENTVEDKAETSDSEVQGTIGEDGAFIRKVEAEDKQNSEETFKENLDNWVANDYKKGDIQETAYKVKYGDTLWEIAEAYYGDGFLWVEILNRNKSEIGYINGEQVLIRPGQVLNL